MAKKTKLEEMFQELVDMARKNLENDGEIMPVFFVHGEGGLKIVGTPFTTDKDKEIAAFGIKMLAHKIKADGVLFITEAWMLKADPKTDLDKVGRISKHPDRVEVVMFELQTKKGTFSAVVEETLLSSGKKTFGEVKLEKAELQGRFSNLLGV